MSTEIAIYQDEATRWGPNAREAMIAAAAARKRRIEETARATQRALAREAQERQERHQAALVTLRVAKVAERARETPRKVSIVIEPHINTSHMRYLRAQRIVLAVAENYGVQARKIFLGDRNQYLALCRHVAIYEVERVTKWSKKKVGRFFHRDHSSVHHAMGKVIKLAAEDEAFRNRLALIEGVIAEI